MRLKLRMACTPEQRVKVEVNGGTFASIRILSDWISPFTAQIFPGPSSYLPPATLNKKWRRETSPYPSTVRKASRLTPLVWRPASVQRTSWDARPVSARSLPERSTAAREKQTAVLGASFSPAPSAHFFNSAPKRAVRGLSLSRIQARDECRRPTMEEEIVDRNGIRG